MDSAVLAMNRKDCEMKPSHYVTPRTLADSTFTTGYQSVNMPRYSLADRAVMWASAIAAVVMVLVIVFLPEVK